MLGPVFINELAPEHSETGGRVAIKDVIDVKDTVTSAGSPFIAEHSQPAERDAACLQGMRRAHAQLVGKTNLHELAFGTTGINEGFGTPPNPLDASLIPGGSS